MIGRSNVQMHDQPSLDATVVTSLDKHQQVNLEQSKDGWLKVSTDTLETGWIPSWFVDHPELETEDSLVAVIDKEMAVYTEATNNSEILGHALIGQVLPVINESLGWLEVEFQEKTGYLQTKQQRLANAKDYPSHFDFNHPDVDYDPKLIEEARKKADPIVTVRVGLQALLSAPDRESALVDGPQIGDQFELIDYVYGVDDDERLDYYYVRDQHGNVGYLEAEIASTQADSIGHVTQTSASSIKDAVIMIDAGHGGIDAGAVNEAEGILEKEQTFATAQRLQESLEKAGATVILAREGDTNPSLGERTDISNTQAVDAFLSLHYDNAIDYEEMGGTTTYFFHESDEALATAVNDQMADHEIGNNGTIFGNYYVLRENTRPALLLELGYMSNENDSKYIPSDKYHQEISEAITKGLIAYFDQ